MEKSSSVLKKCNQNNLRRLMLIQKTKHDHTKSNTAKLNSPLAKYDCLGNLTCIICRQPVKSASVWKVHINSKLHKQNIEATKKAKEHLLSHVSEAPLNTSNRDCSTDTEGSSNAVVNDYFITLKPQEIKVQPTNSNEEPLPEKFFDDPLSDAKVRNVEYKDPQEEEWEKFQREIKEETTMSNAIIAGEQNESSVIRQIEEIDEQMGRWAKVIHLEERKEFILKKTKERCVKKEKHTSDESSDEESYPFNEFSDWRSKRF